MTEHAIPWHDDTRRPVREKAETLLEIYRLRHDCLPTYLRAGLHDAYLLAAAGFSDVPIVADENVQRHCFYAIGRT